MMQSPGLFYHGLGTPMSMDAVAGGILPIYDKLHH